MTRQTSVRLLRLKSLVLLAIATFVTIAAGFGTPQSASAYWVCPPTSPVTRAPYFTCNHGTYRNKIAYVEKSSSPRAYAIYRSYTYGGASVSGSQFYSPTSDYFLQDFYCNAGYPNAYNRHSVKVDVEFTLAGTGSC